VSSHRSRSHSRSKRGPPGTCSSRAKQARSRSTTSLASTWVPAVDTTCRKAASAQGVNRVEREASAMC
jgi:hypothetical protein